MIYNNRIINLNIKMKIINLQCNNKKKKQNLNK